MAHPLAGARPIVVTHLEAMGGAERSIIALSRWLHEQGLAHYVLCYEDLAGIVRHAAHPIQVVELKPSPGMRNGVRSFRHHFAEIGPTPFKPLMSGYQAAVHGSMAGVRGFHCLMHDTPSLFSGALNGPDPLRSRLRNWLRERVVGRGLRSGGITMVNSEFLRAECRRYWNIDARILRMGGLASSDPSRIRLCKGTLNMLSVCRIEANKRLDWLLLALAQLEQGTFQLSSRVDWHADFAGGGALIAELQQMAASLGIADRVTFHGFVSDQRLQELYDDAHLFLMPARQGYGIPAVESIRRGIPILLHRESGVSDVLLDTPWATVLEGGMQDTPAALQTALEGVLTGKHHTAPPPSLPTEDEWAQQVARYGNWI